MAYRALVLIPSFNSGPQLRAVVQAARAQFQPVWVVVDGSTDGSDAGLESGCGLRVERLARNQGKGAAIRHGLALAVAEGFTHVLTMDADGQHPAALIGGFIAASRASPTAMILGVPVFDAAAPAIRVQGRRISNALVAVQTLGGGIGDCLFGFRVFPAAALLAVMARTPWMRRYDFDAEAVVRLSWRGVRAVNLPAPVRYLTPAQGGVSHFRYGRDNLLLAWMHARLLAGAIVRLPRLLLR